MNLEDKELIALFEGLDTPGVSDALDKLGLPGQCLGVAPLDNYRKVIVGPAFTVQYVSASVPPGTVGDFIEDVAPGDVVVIDNGGRTDRTVWGDIMTQSVNQPVSIGTARVCARDIVVADANGVVIVPRARAAEVAACARQIEAVEADIRALIAQGKTLKEARDALGYHSLQRKV